MSVTHTPPQLNVFVRTTKALYRFTIEKSIQYNQYREKRAIVKNDKELARIDAQRILFNYFQGRIPELEDQAIKVFSRKRDKLNAEYRLLVQESTILHTLVH